MMHIAKTEAILKGVGVSYILLQMVPLINATTDVLMNNLNAYAESGQAFDIYK